MSDKASVSSPFTNIGLVPDGGASFHFYHHLGYKRAFAAIAECSLLDAKTCLEMGMVNKVVPGDSLLAETTKWAHSLADRAPLALSYSKKILRQLPGLDSQAAARLESEYQNKCANSEDASSAIKAFITKTKAVFKGR
jgi:2-(1,2-epoxy-1,2-dihydrophenyl)acetyl-CoA isomerase